MRTLPWNLLDHKLCFFKNGKVNKGGNKSTSEIEKYLSGSSQRIGKPNLYYHLSELSSVRIIEAAKYREEGGGALEKTWKLAVEKIVIDLLGGTISGDCRSQSCKKEKERVRSDQS